MAHNHAIGISRSIDEYIFHQGFELTSQVLVLSIFLN